jgi:hypothetical protein
MPHPYWLSFILLFKLLPELIIQKILREAAYHGLLHPFVPEKFTRKTQFFHF